MAIKTSPRVTLSFPEWMRFKTVYAAEVCRTLRRRILPAGVFQRGGVLRAALALLALTAGSLLVLPMSGQSATYAGTQTILASGLGSPAGIAVDSANTVYIADTNNARILVETPGTSGYTQTVITNSAVVAPVAIAVDSARNLYVINRGSTTNLVRLTTGTYAPQVISSSVGTPNGVAVTPNGTALYVVDTSAGSVYQYAYTSGSYVQQTTATGFTQPLGVATDASGAWYVLANGSILKHAAGFASGTEIYGSLVSGLSPTANALDLDAVGNIFVADTGNNRIVEAVRPSSGSSYTLQTLASSNAPKGVGVDSNGVVSFANTVANTVVAQNLAAPNFGTVNVGTTSAAQVLIFAFSATTTLNASAPYQALLGGAGNLDYAVVAGSGTSCTANPLFTSGTTCSVKVTFTPAYPGPRNGALLLNDSNGAQTGLAYLAGAGSGPQVAFSPVQAAIGSGLSFPAGVAVDGAGNVYIADYSNNRVVKEVYSNGTYTQSSIGSGFYYPTAVAVDGAGNVYIADSGNGRVVKELYSNGTYTFSSIGSGLNYPESIAVDAAGNVFVADTFSNRVVKEIYSNGGYTQSSTTIGSGLSFPAGVAVDGAGNVYIADSGHSRVVKEVYSNGTYTQSVTSIGSGLSYPYGVAVDGAGNLYIADSTNNFVFKEVYSNGTYTQSNTTIGTGLKAPQGVAVDGTGNIYIADANNSRVLLENVQRPPALSFASTAVGTTSADSPQQVVVSNTGDQALTVSSVTLNPATNFTADASACLATPIVGGGSCALNFSYTPAQAGSRNSMASIFDNTLLVAGTRQQLNMSGTATKGNQTLTFVQPVDGSTYTSGSTIPYSATSNAPTAGINFQVTKTGTVTYSRSGGSNNTGTVTITGGSGTITITASQNGTSDYNAATSVSVTINVIAGAGSGATLADTAVGSSTSATITVPLTTAGTLSSVQGLLQGITGLDYSTALGSDCAAGQAVTVGQACSLQVTFSPTKAGPRYGAAQLLDATGNILGTTYLQANGLGPQIAFVPTQTVFGSSLMFPFGLAVDGAGNVYIADSNNNRVVKETYSNGNYTQSGTTIGSGLYFPGSVAVDGAGNVYIADSSNNRVLKEVYSNGTYTQSGTAIGSGLSSPFGVAVDGAGNIYIADTSNDRVVKEVYSNGTYTQSGTTIGSGLSSPFGVAVDAASNVYIADLQNSRVLKEIYSNGTYTQSSTTIGSGLSSPAGVAVDGAGNVYIADTGNGRVVKEIYSNGTYTQSSATIGSGLNNPRGLAIDGAGNVYIADTANLRGLVERVDGVVPPTVDFTMGGTATTATGATSAPLATTITNLGNQPLIFPVPLNGLNPQTAVNFALETNSDTTCPVVNAGGTAGQLAANARCTLSYVFAPTQLGTLNSTSVLTDNNLNVTGATQTIKLKGQGTQGTQTAQTITFPQPTGTVYPGSATLAASASSGLPVTYTASGPATLSGSILTYTAPGTVVVTANQAGNVQYSAAPPVSITITVTQAVAQISWSPSRLFAYTGATLDATILDATDSIPATISYTALQPSGTAIDVDSTNYTTVLTQKGTYALTAKFTPNDSVRFAITSTTLPFTVQNMNVFVANAAGTVSSLYNNGTTETSGVSGGGLGAAVDSSGFVWSINADRKGVSKFTNVGALAGSYSNVGGISAATALTVDGNGTVWVANGGGTVSAVTSSGTAAQSAVGSAANLSSPASISVDPAGSLWIANTGNNTVTEIIGAAAPVNTPLAQSVVNNTVAARP